MHDESIAYSQRAGVRLTPAFRTFLIWALASTIAFAMQLNWMSATYSPDGFVPVGNDAFYHARRIIDTAADPAAFYEFDQRIHAPEGSLLVWPWGYDFAMGMLLRAGTALGLASDPMHFLAYVPPFAVLIVILLLVVIAHALRLSTPATALLTLCVALSPLTQGMHGIGSIDHHFAEYIAVLGCMAALLWWTRDLGSSSAAAALAVVLGLAPAIHNGLFVLQALSIVCLGVLWMRGVSIPRRSAVVFAVVLALTTLAILLPSLPFRQGRFDYFLLSWFHLYVACCASVVVLAFAWLRPRGRTIATIVVLGLMLGLPLVGDVQHVSSFVGKEASALQNITEARSVWSHLQERGVDGISRIYSALIFLVPIVWVGCAVALLRSRDPRIMVVCIHALLTLPLMLAQHRFHYFGSLAMYLPILVWADRRYERTGRMVWVMAAAALLAAAYYPNVRHGLAGGLQLGNDVYYKMTRLAMPALADACSKDPGIVLARNNEGHFIRYHTDCSVIANNFLLTEQHFEAIRRVDALFGMTPEQLLASGFPVDYVFVRARGIVLIREDGSIGLVPPEEATIVSDTLTDHLLWGDVVRVPPEFQMIAEVKVPGGSYQYARIWKIKRRASVGGHGSSSVVGSSGANDQIASGIPADTSQPSRIEAER